MRRFIADFATLFYRVVLLIGPIWALVIIWGCRDERVWLTVPFLGLSVADQVYRFLRGTLEE